MALHALVSPGGSPGVTTAAIALALTWPGSVVLAECDPSGGDILTGLFGGHLPARPGLLAVALEAGRGSAAAAAALQSQLVEMDGDFTRMLLTGITDPRQVSGLVPAWPVIAQAMSEQPGDVIADCGRLGAGEAPLPVLAAAATITVVIRPSLRQVAKAKPRIEMLAGLPGGPGRITLLLTGQGPYSAREVAKALGRPALGLLPHDTKTAQVLSDGAGSWRGLAGRPLMRAAQVTARAWREHAAVMAPPGARRTRAAR